ncbi:MAG: 50S ribosomal protein L23 [Myxococcota bacterium]
MKNPYNILKIPILSEKSTKLRDERNQYVFEVHPEANKVEIKEAVEKIFEVKVLKVNTQVRRGKMKRTLRITGKRANRKFAVVTLKQGDTIPIHEGV